MALILVADDHPLNRHFLTTLLSYYGHEVTEAADGLEALEAARKRRPDLIIADVAMPRVDGPALVQALRGERLGDIPVVFYTASYAEVESRAIAQAAGVEHVIAKPSDPEVVLDTVHRALGQTQGAPTPASPSLREHVMRLQAASIRMSAVIELTAVLSSEADPEQILRVACRGIRRIFGADSAVIAVGGERAAEGCVETARLEELAARVGAIVGRDPIRAAGAAEPLASAASVAVAGTRVALLVPMLDLDTPCGWVLLTARGEAPFSIDDERLAAATASHVYAAYEGRRAAIADRQRIEDELRTSRADLTALVEASPVAIVGFDRDGVIESWNSAAQRTFRWRADEVIGTDVLAKPFQRMMDDCRAGKACNGVEQTVLRKDEARVDVIVSMAPLHDIHGEVRGFVCIVDDVTELHASHERLRALSARLLNVQEEERTILARELHDDLGQLLTAIRLEAVRLPPRLCATILPLIDTTLETVVRIVSQVRPSRIGEMGLAVAVERKLADFQKRTQIATSLEIDPPTLEVRGELGTTMFRILEEALTNIARHSGATRVDVRLEQRNGTLILEVQDNGRGIGVHEQQAPDSYGLIGMRERAVVCGGTLEITGGKGRGTVVTARIPVGSDSSADR